jgi:hypothetical protein
VTATSRTPWEFALRWRDGRGCNQSSHRLSTVKVVQLVLQLRWDHGDDFPVEIARRLRGGVDRRWSSSSWDELVCCLTEREMSEFRVRQGWIEPYWWVDR